MKRLFVVLFCLFSVVIAFAQKSKKPAVLKKDSTAITVQHFNDAAIKKYAADPEFQYVEGQKAEPSWWDRFWYWFWQWLGDLLSSAGLSHPSIKYILVGLAAIGGLFLILKSAGLLKRTAKKVSLPYQESLENIHEIDFDSEIENAIALRNFRLAVRLQYLKCLKQLSDAGLINWQIDKTNTAYYYELTNPVQREAFGSITRRFEYVWYGDFPIDEHAFGNINVLFQQFKTKL
ncbi:DUF4129 domain-containing protein [Mucilaginibacter limnophilus]|uniref:DUF4129 domain-containing protein n=1 Tax=Mucilaginibacter limnophilus TaxID=1932778 RepID=A0A437MW75_9SPHI|nr:DUF4129 domain-containing protein [Mucilaginibacter limnophilus]RVU01921.1 DUF4129 domain-containing protein [Mucilaginibacter limnophilus]